MAEVLRHGVADCEGRELCRESMVLADDGMTVLRGVRSRRRGAWQVFLVVERVESCIQRGRGA
jgi:hypothetical protein